MSAESTHAHTANFEQVLLLLDWSSILKLKSRPVQAPHNTRPYIHAPRIY